MAAAGSEVPPFEVPLDWIHKTNECMEIRYLQLYLERQKDDSARRDALDRLLKLDVTLYGSSIPRDEETVPVYDEWYREILYVRALEKEHSLQVSSTPFDQCPTGINDLVPCKE
jgi:hypothetical protein